MTEKSMQVCKNGNASSSSPIYHQIKSGWDLVTIISTNAIYIYVTSNLLWRVYCMAHWILFNVMRTVC